MPHDPAVRLLGKREAKKPHAMLREFVDIEKAARHLPANIVNSATPHGAAMSVALAMYLNDQEGDCVAAAVGNLLRVNSRGSVQITDSAVQAAYVAVTGIEGAAYDPSTGANDNGCYPLDMLDYWVSPGIGGDKLLGHAGVDMTNQLEVRTALWMCGGIYPGWQLSTDQQSQQVWQPGPASPGSWGGHCAIVTDWWTQVPVGLTIGSVPIPQTPGGAILAIGTWGMYQPALPSFVPWAADEGHALITDAFLKAHKRFIDQAKLQAYLKTLQPEQAKPTAKVAAPESER